MSFYTRHAHARALERYSLDLSASDFQSIGKACASGEAPSMHRNDKGTVHLWTFRGETLVVLLNNAKDRILTFLPPRFFEPKAKRKHRGSKAKLKQRSAAAKFSLRSTKGRSTNGALIREAMEDA